MGILPIGFFSPLPLAMMIPFMATQSLAMGEAFGKSFQYGKRKISAMSNEEFNKLTFHDLMTQQTANIRDIIPNLHEQMVESQRMQQDIFSEMIKIIPTFFTALFNALDPKLIEYPTPLPGLKIPVPSPTPASFATTATEPTLISHENYTPPLSIISSKSQYSQAIFRAMSLNELILGINSGRFTGSDLSLAKHTLNQRQQPIDPTTIPTTATAEQTAHQAWQKNLDTQLGYFLYHKNLYYANRGSTSSSAVSRTAKALSAMRNLISLIRKLSQDYRNPNNAIRRDVIKLRQQIANNLLDY